MRQTQIIFEATLKQLVHVHSLVQDYWGYSFESLVENDENDDSVLSTICDPSGNRIVIKSRYVSRQISCDLKLSPVSTDY
jgi:FAD-dependent monooxygenase